VVGLAEEVAVRDPMKRSKLIIFTRYPEPGCTKTRLIGTLGAQGAADLQRQMTEWTVRAANAARAKSKTDIEICFTGGDEQKMRKWLGASLAYRPQVGRDLGERMANAFQSGFAEGYRRIVLIGTDCPELTADILDKAFGVLEQHDVVIGPTHDGGYYLIGMTDAFPQVFTHMPWGTDAVLEKTLDVLRSIGVTWGLTDKLRDVDVPEDLVVWESAVGGG